MSHSARYKDRALTNGIARAPLLNCDSDTDPDVVDILYNSDLSGPVTLFVPQSWVDTEHTRPTPSLEEKAPRYAVQIPGDILLQFISDHVRRERIAALEQDEIETVLGLKVPNWLPRNPRR
jgi:hypothetical protein